MKKLMFSLLLIACISCEKYEEYSWRCDVTLIIYPSGAKCPDTIRNQVYHHAMTRDQLSAYIMENNKETVQIFEGDTVLIKSIVENCGETVGCK